MYIYRTTTMPSLQKLLELERLTVVDNSGINTPIGTGTVRACIVAEFPQGPFAPTIVTSPGDVVGYFVGQQAKTTILSQSGLDPTTAVQDGSGVTFDGNGWMELKGKTFSALTIQRVDCDMVAASPSSTKNYIKFTVDVNAADITSSKTNKDIVIPAGTRFGNDATGTVNIIATSQQVLIPAGTACTGSIVCGINFVQDAASGAFTFSTSPTTGVTAFFVKGVSATAGGAIDTAMDVTLQTYNPGLNSGTVIDATASVIVLAGTAGDAYAASAGLTQPSAYLADCIAACYFQAISKTLPGVDATNDIVVIWSARNWHFHGTTGYSATDMRKALWTNAKTASMTGRGRVAAVTAQPASGVTQAIQTTTKGYYTGLKSTDGVATTDADADRYWPCGPFQEVFATEVNADVMISACGFRAAMKVNLANAGQSEYLTSVGQPYNANIQAIDAQEPCFAAYPLVDNVVAGSDYVAMKAAGVAWLVRDRAAGWWFYSGVTGADPIQWPSRIDDNRRSFADEIQDMIFNLATQYAKLPGTVTRQDAFAGDMKVYLEQLVNPGVGDSRAKAYQVLEGQAAGNTDALNGQGIFLWSVTVQMNGSMKAIVVNAQIGTNVVIAQVA